jgi:DNA modification methylase
VICGDAIVRTVVDRLMVGEAGDIVFSDPPYNVAYEGYTEDRLKIQGDRMTAEQFQQFLLSTFSSYRRIVKSGASIYICHSSSWQREFQNAMETAGFEVRCQIIWAKNTFALGALADTSSNMSRSSMRTLPGRRIPGTGTNRNPPYGRRKSRQRIVFIRLPSRSS